MSVTPFQGPVVRDLSTNPVDGFLPPARGINAYMTAQASYLASGAVPTSATNANPPVVTQPALLLVINTGTSISYGVVNATTVTLPSGSVPQDVYCDVTLAGVFTTQHGAPGFTPSAPASNALRIWKVTTGAGNVGVVLPFTDLANRSPFNPALTGVMAVDGHNAGAVTLPGTLALTQPATYNGGLTAKGNIVQLSSGDPIQQVQGAPIVSQGLPPSMTCTFLTGSNSSRGRITFSISSMSFVTGLTVYLYLNPINGFTFGQIGGFVTAQDAPTVALRPFMFPSGGTVVPIEIQNPSLMVAGTTYKLCYKMFAT